MKPCTFVLAAAAVAAAACRHADPPRPPEPPPGEVWLTPDQVRDAHIAVEPLAEHEVGGAIVTSGRIAFDDLHVSHVYSPVTGRVIKILAQPGDRVKKGDALAVIASPDVGAAFSDLAKARADLAAAENDYKRQKELFEAHAGSQREFEAAQDTWHKARAEYERAASKARLLRGGAAADVEQEYTLRALIDGEVISRSVNPGAEVSGLYSGGAAVELFTIGELDPVWVIADVFEMDVAHVRAGARVSVRVVAWPDLVFEGHVDWVSGALDPTSRTAKVRCRLRNPDRKLKPEMYATVSIAVDARRAPAIPRAAMLRLADQTFAFVELGPAPSAPGTPGNLIRFERRPINVSEEEGGDWLPVTHGLQPGERVVVSGAILLSEMR